MVPVLAAPTVRRACRVSAPCAHLDFVIIGAMKAGTTSVFDFLSAQPGVHAPRNKEPHYFTHGYRMPSAYYRSLFRGRQAGQLNGEASPTYSWTRGYPLCASRIAADAPGVRVIYLVRDPIERILSHHRHHVLLGQRSSSDLATLGDPALWDRSRYRETIETYLRHIDRERLFVADLEDLQRDERGLRSLLDFLDLAQPGSAVGLPVANASASRTAVPGVVGRIARTPIGSVLRDVVPAERLQRMKDRVARPASVAATDEGTVVDAEAIRRMFPTLCDEVDAEYAWVGAEFLDR